MGGVPCISRLPSSLLFSVSVGWVDGTKLWKILFRPDAGGRRCVGAVMVGLICPSGNDLGVRQHIGDLYFVEFFHTHVLAWLIFV